MKHTHVGHCQNCGRVQASSPRLEGFIAKHGYNVEYGYFSGTCSGSNKAPLETSRTYCDEVVAACMAAHSSHQRSAHDLREKFTNPARCLTGTRREFVNGRPTDVAVYAAWEEATEEQREKQRAADIDEHVRHARFMHDHAVFLMGLAARVHGQPLQAVPPEVTDPVQVGVKFQLGSKMEGYQVTQTKVPGGLGGRAVYTLVKRISDGRVLKWSTVSVRKHVLAGRID